MGNDLNGFAQVVAAPLFFERYNATCAYAATLRGTDDAGSCRAYVCGLDRPGIVSRIRLRPRPGRVLVGTFAARDELARAGVDRQARRRKESR